MADRWFYLWNGQQVGPVTADQLRAALSAGQLSGSDMVWKEGMPQWVTAAAAPELAAAVQVAAPPPPAAGIPRMPQQSPGGYGPGPAGYGHVGTVPYYTPRDYGTYAGFWARFAAVFIDGLILMVVNIPISLAAAFMAGSSDEAQVAFSVFNWVISIVIGWLYEALQVSSAKQATIGKAALGIYVTDLNGERVTFARATGRYFAKIISSCLLIGYLIALFTEKKQALHDLIAGTLVMRK